MKKRIIFIICTCIIAVGLSFAACKQKDSDEKRATISQIVGVTHVDGKYFHNDKTDFLNEGADAIAGIGTNVIKLWFSTRNYASNYYYNSDWSQFTVNNMVDLAKTNYYQNVFNRPQFKTFILEANAIENKEWRDGLNKEEYDLVYNEFYNITKYFRENSDFVCKTFILQNWESDNALKAAKMSSVEEQETGIQGMIDYFNVMQDAINDAKKATPESNVNVYGAVEVNKVPYFTTYNFPTVIDHVIPYTHMDLYSYSDWYTKKEGDEWKIWGLLDYIAEKAPDSETFGEKNIYLGEFGSHEIMVKSGDKFDENSDRKQREVLAKQLQLALRWGVKYAAYWEIYCNELRGGIIIGSKERATEDQLKGLWLIRPDGSKTSSYNYVSRIMSEPVNSYRYVCEAENQDMTVSSGIEKEDFYDLSLSGAYGSKISANATGDYAQYSIYVPQAGKYDLYIGYVKDSSLGEFQLKIDDIIFGDKIDCYSSKTKIISTKSIPVSFDSYGNKNFKFEVSGKNKSSSGYNLVIDYIKLVPVNVIKEKIANTVTEEDYAKALENAKDLLIQNAFKNEKTQTVDNTVRLKNPRIKDTFDSWNIMYSKTDNLSFGSGNAYLYFDGDMSRLRRISDTPENVVYNLNDITNFEVKVYYYEQVKGTINIYTSPDNENWTPIELTHDSPADMSGSWYRTYLRPKADIPKGTNYLKLELLDDPQIWTPQVSDIFIK